MTEVSPTTNSTSLPTASLANDSSEASGDITSGVVVDNKIETFPKVTETLTPKEQVDSSNQKIDSMTEQTDLIDLKSDSNQDSQESSQLSPESSKEKIDETVSKKSTSMAESIKSDSPLHVILPEEQGQGDGEQLSGANAQPSTSAAGPPSPEMSVYHIKWIKWKDNKTAIITQNENGPCPLIAIMNVLILKGKVHLPPMMEMITAGQLMEYLGDSILEYAPQDISEDTQLNYEQNMHDAIAVLPKLQTGLDVNVKFTGVSDFEYTPECIIFDLLNIPLYHGWLVDPQNPTVVAAVGHTSYNQLVERIITDKASQSTEIVTNALIAETFLERTASQLTYHGLCELNSAIQEDELGVLFRNNHFSMVYKHKNELFQLVTDQGFLTESNVVWETLSNIDGDGQFVDSHFCTVPPKAASSVLPALGPSDQQVDQDYMVALSLQEEQRRQEEQEIAWQEYKEKQLGVSDNVTDEELARRLQYEEQQEVQSDESVVRQYQSVPAAVPERHPETKKKSDCVIL